MSTIRESNNRLLQEELDFDRIELAAEHKKLLNELNVEQRKIYDAVIQDVACNSGGFTLSMVMEELVKHIFGKH